MDLINYFSNQNKSEKFNTGNRNFKNTAFYSLKIALKAYFNTYHSMLDKLYYRDNDDIEEASLGYLYYESYVETIVHTQHFFELIIKDILEKENPLLILRVNDKPVILHKLLQREEITEEEYNKLFSIEFTDALNTFCELVKNDRISKSKYKIISDNSNVLKALNNFRNRIWHRGLFVLKYHALDEFMCKHLLPLIINTVNIDEYKSFNHEWRYDTENQLGIDVFNELIKEFESDSVDYTKIALLKEIGRACYNIETKHLQSISEDEKTRAIKKIEEKYNMVFAAQECPVCGKKSLLNYYDIDTSIEELGDEMSENFAVIEVPYQYERNVSCTFCGFEVNKFIKDPNAYGFGDVFFWQEEY